MSILFSGRAPLVRTEMLSICLAEEMLIRKYVHGSLPQMDSSVRGCLLSPGDAHSDQMFFEFLQVTIQQHNLVESFRRKRKQKNCLRVIMVTL